MDIKGKERRNVAGLGGRETCHMLKEPLDLHLRHAKGRQFWKGKVGTRRQGLVYHKKVQFYSMDPRSLELLEIFGEAKLRLHIFFKLSYRIKNYIFMPQPLAHRASE